MNLGLAICLSPKDVGAALKFSKVNSRIYADDQSEWATYGKHYIAYLPIFTAVIDRNMSVIISAIKTKTTAIDRKLYMPRRYCDDANWLISTYNINCYIKTIPLCDYLLPVVVRPQDVGCSDRAGLESFETARQKIESFYPRACDIVRANFGLAAIAGGAIERCLAAGASPTLASDADIFVNFDTPPEYEVSDSISDKAQKINIAKSYMNKIISVLPEHYLVTRRNHHGAESKNYHTNNMYTIHIPGEPVIQVISSGRNSLTDELNGFDSYHAVAYNGRYFIGFDSSFKAISTGLTRINIFPGNSHHRAYKAAMRGYKVDSVHIIEPLSDKIWKYLVPPPIIYPGVPLEYNMAILREHYPTLEYDIKHVQRYHEDVTVTNDIE